MVVSSWWCTSDGGVVIFRGGLAQLHRFGKRTQLIHAPRVYSHVSCSQEGIAHSSHYLMKTFSMASVLAYYHRLPMPLLGVFC